MTEHEDNRVHYLIDACEVRGHLDITPDDLSLILMHQRELGKEDALAHLAENLKHEIDYLNENGGGIGDLYFWLERMKEGGANE